MKSNASVSFTAILLNWTINVQRYLTDHLYGRLYEPLLN